MNRIIRAITYTASCAFVLYFPIHFTNWLITHPPQTRDDVTSRFLVWAIVTILSFYFVIGLDEILYPKQVENKDVKKE